MESLALVRPARLAGASVRGIAVVTSRCFDQRTVSRAEISCVLRYGKAVAATTQMIPTRAPLFGPMKSDAVRDWIHYDSDPDRESRSCMLQKIRTHIATIREVLSLVWSQASALGLPRKTGPQPRAVKRPA